MDAPSSEISLPKEWKYIDAHPKELIIGDTSKGVQTRSSFKNFCANAAFLSQIEPKCIDEEMSLGDFVLTGGEIPAMAITDCVCRYVDGVISGESLSEESFTDNLLEYPQFTRPQEFMGLTVPEVLVSGNHKEVDKWRKNEALKLTERLRPDLIKKEN